MDTKFGNEPCGDGELLMSFMYDELTADDQMRFSRHLASCQVCAEELAALGGIRSEVAFWKQSEFDKLPTPVVSLPTPTNQTPVVPVAMEPERGRFIDWFTGIFAIPRTVALGASAFAAIIVAVGAFFILAGAGRQDSTLADGKQNRPGVTPTATVVTSTPPTAGETTTSTVRNETISPTPEARPAINPAGPKTTVAVPAKSARTGVRRNEQTAPAPRTTATPKPVRKTVPAVEMAEEDETDDSLRLAELFDEIGAR